MLDKLPQELQNKVFYYYATHPCARMVKEWYYRCYCIWARYEYKSGYYMDMTEIEHAFHEHGFFLGGRVIPATGRKSILSPHSQK